MKTERTAVAVALCAVLLAAGCATMRESRDVGGPEGGPLWTRSVGEWEQEWNKAHPEDADRYIWVVGTSGPVESEVFERNAEKSAADDAMEQLVNALGVSASRLAMGVEAWSDETRDLVIGSYKEALKVQMARRNVNLRVYDWYRYRAGSGAATSFLKKGLFRLDRRILDQNLADETAAEFARNLKARAKLNAQVQKELVDRVKEVTRKRMEELTSE